MTHSCTVCGKIQDKSLICLDCWKKDHAKTPIVYTSEELIIAIKKGHKFIVWIDKGENLGGKLK